MHSKSMIFIRICTQLAHIYDLYIRLILNGFISLNLITCFTIIDHETASIFSHISYMWYFLAGSIRMALSAWLK